MEYVLPPAGVPVEQASMSDESPLRVMTGRMRPGRSGRLSELSNCRPAQGRSARAGRRTCGFCCRRLRCCCFVGLVDDRRGLDCGFAWVQTAVAAVWYSGQGGGSPPLSTCPG